MLVNQSVVFNLYQCLYFTVFPNTLCNIVYACILLSVFFSFVIFSVCQFDTVHVDESLYASYLYLKKVDNNMTWDHVIIQLFLLHFTFRLLKITFSNASLNLQRSITQLH